MVAELPTRRRPLSPPSAIDALTPDENEDDKIKLNPEAEKFEEKLRPSLATAALLISREQLL